MSDPSPNPPAASSWSPRAFLRGRQGKLLGLILLALVLPRTLALGGVEVTSPLSFIDMAEHLYNLDLLSKRAFLSSAQVRDPYFQKNPKALELRYSHKWPAGVYVSAVPWARLFGPLSIWTTLLTNLLFTVVMIWGLVGLGRFLGDSEVGLWAALLAVLCPALVASSWYFSLDYPNTAMTVMGLYLLCRTRDFSRLRPCLVLALWSGLGMWIKPTYPIYLAVPAAWAFYRGLRHGPRLRVALHVLVCGAIASPMAIYLLDLRWAKVWEQLKDHAALRLLPGSAIDPLSADWFLAQLKFAWFNYPFPLLILCLPGLVLLSSWRRPIPGRWPVLSYILGAVVLLTLMVNKGERYIQPVYPLLCLVTAWWIVRRLPGVWRQGVMILAVLSYATMLYLSHEIPTPWLPEMEQEANWRCKPTAPTDCLPWRNNAGHPFWFEQTMPGRLHLETLRGQWDIFCRYRPLIRQVERWVNGLPNKRPLAVTYIRDVKQEPGELPYAWLVALVSQAVQDRFVLAPGVAGLPVLPRWVSDVPSLVILHIPELNPESVNPELRVTARQTFKMACGPGHVSVTLSLAHPKKP